MVGIAKVLRRHVGGVRTRALQHHDRFNSVVRRKITLVYHGKAVERWEYRKPTPIPPDAKVTTHSGGGKFDPFFKAMYVDHYPRVRVQHSDGDTTCILTATLRL